MTPEWVRADPAHWMSLDGTETPAKSGVRRAGRPGTEPNWVSDDPLFISPTSAFLAKYPLISSWHGHCNKPSHAP